MNTIIMTQALHGQGFYPSGFCQLWPSPCDFESLNGVAMQVSFKLKFHDIIDNRDYMDTIIVMLENPQSLSPNYRRHKLC